MPRHTSSASREAALLQGTLDIVDPEDLALDLFMVTGSFSAFNKSPGMPSRFDRVRSYPALYRLENRRWVKAEWKMTDGGREAKYYRLTTAGRRQFEEEQASWKRLTDVISLVLKTTE